jgi:hypothetical protein
LNKGVRIGNTRGVKNYRETGTGTGKPGNRKTGNRETGDLVPVLKNQKPGTPVPVPGFWYPVFTGIPGTSKIIYIHILFYYFILCLVYIN